MNLSVEDLLRIAKEGEVLKVMGRTHKRTLTLDYVPARAAMIIPRLDAEDEGVTAMPPHVEPITFRLEDAEFGHMTFVALTCRGFVIVNPFPFTSYEALAEVTIR